jgi:hypothetical protein
LVKELMFGNVEAGEKARYRLGRLGNFGDERLERTQLLAGGVDIAFHDEEQAVIPARLGQVGLGCEHVGDHLLRLGEISRVGTAERRLDESQLQPHIIGKGLDGLRQQRPRIGVPAERAIASQKHRGVFRRVIAAVHPCLQPGDDVQAIKAGLLEIADVLAVNKTDMPLADFAAKQLKAMLKLREKPRQEVPLATTSAKLGDGNAKMHSVIMARMAGVRGNRTEMRERRMRRLIAQAVGNLSWRLVLDNSDGEAETLMKTASRGGDHDQRGSQKDFEQDRIGRSDRMKCCRVEEDSPRLVLPPHRSPGTVMLRNEGNKRERRDK